MFVASGNCNASATLSTLGSGIVQPAGLSVVTTASVTVSEPAINVTGALSLLTYIPLNHYVGADNVTAVLYCGGQFSRPHVLQLRVDPAPLTLTVLPGLAAAIGDDQTATFNTILTAGGPFLHWVVIV